MPKELENVAKAICLEKGLDFNKFVDNGTYKETYQVIKDQRSLALKVFRNGFSPERTQREIEAMIVCDHPNISKLIHVEKFNYSGQIFLYLLEDFFSGGTLTSKILERCMTRDEIITLALRLIDAVSHIASKGLVHRDLKPDNIMFRDDGFTPVIVDFGIVRNLGRSSLTHNWLMQGPGTPYFAAPEQLNNQKELIDWRTDQFSLGVLLAFGIFRIHPFAQENDTPDDVVMRVANREPIGQAFKEKCTLNGLTQLLSMAAPWPISRYRTPAELFNVWNKE